MVGNSNNIFTVVKSNRFLVANYAEANPVHYVTVQSISANITEITGMGVYSNGQNAVISAQLMVTNPPVMHVFKEFRLNGVFYSATNILQKTFSTHYPSNMNYVAIYDTHYILPLIANVTLSHQQPVPATN